MSTAAQTALLHIALPGDKKKKSAFSHTWGSHTRSNVECEQVGGRRDEKEKHTAREEKECWETQMESETWRRTDTPAGGEE